MEYHLTLFLYIVAFVHSIIGYGFILSNIINKKLLSTNIGYIGIIGFFFVSLISIFTSFFFPHDYTHNIILHSIGLGAFLILIKNYEKLKELKFLWLLIVILWLGIYVYKNHDDFPYYHLTYALNLSENSFAVGTGHFSHGFRTFSSLFFFHSILFMPYIDFYLFHSGPFFIILFFNFIIISELIKNFKKKNFNFIYFFSILSIIFINIAFYRLAEHGTDRSAQILLILIFILFFDIIFLKNNNDEILLKFNLLLIIVFLASSMKAIYYLYLILIPIILFKKKLFFKFINKKNYLIIFFISLSFFLNLSINYFNTGCLLYPAEKTCIVKQEWSINKEEVKLMSLHYEWWSKAGGGPGYRSEIEPKIYVKNFNWVQNWIDRHFFNKVSDTLFGIILISFIVFFTFKYFSLSKIKKKKISFFAFSIPFFFLIEWFLNHPSMRYGGYVLFAIPFFLFTSFHLEKYNFNKKMISYLTIFFVLLSLTTYNLRNISRIVKETKIYNYKLFKSPYFFIDDIQFYEIVKNDSYRVYSTKDGQMCWASKTPCSYNTNISVKKFLWMNMVYRNDK